MLPHREFETLRLSQFLPAAEIVRLDDWRFDDRVWIGEAAGFTEWLRPASDPHRLGVIALDLASLPADVADRCFARLDLPLHRHMRLPDLVGVLGPPRHTVRFGDDRLTHAFRTTGPDAYDVDCTVLDEDGLAYVSIARRIP